MNPIPYQFAGDEAGDVSFRFERGATRHFVVALIGTPEPDRLRHTLKKVRSQFHLPANFEFKFHRLGNRRLRAGLWEALKPLDFNAWVVVARKQQLPGTIRIMSPRAFYVYFIGETIRLIPEAIREGSPLWLDEFDRSGKTITELKRSFGRRDLRYGFRRIRAVRSHSEGLVQIADVVAGAILRRYSRSDSEGYQRLAGKIVSIVEYPPKQNPPG